MWAPAIDKHGFNLRMQTICKVKIVLEIEKRMDYKEGIK